MKKITTYQAGDGTVFDLEEDCLAYEFDNLNAVIAERLGLPCSPAYKVTIGLLMGKIARAVRLGVIHLDNPKRTAYSHMRKWLDQDQADLVSCYQDWLQMMGVKLGRTPNAVHTRLREAYKEMADNGEHIKV